MRCALYGSSAGARLGSPGPQAATRTGLSALTQSWYDDYVQRGRPWEQTLLPHEYLPGGPLAESCVPGRHHLLGLRTFGDVYFADSFTARQRKL